jgi:hypothetical protein
MNLNPDALRSAQEMLSENPTHWIGLDGMFEKLQSIADSSDFTAGIAAKIAALSQKAVPGGVSADIAAASEALVDNFDKHLNGYGMILAAPGVRVVDNTVEGQAPINIGADSRGAPGGILLTGGKNFSDMLAYFLLLEESFPLLNLGAQGTRFDRNSLQWGTGHGLSFSSLPLMVDLKIENNEIQNHGLSGIYCDATTLSTLLRGAGLFNGKLFDTQRIGALNLGSFQSILAVLLGTYKLKIVGNEINQCFNSEADEFYAASPPADVYSPTDSLQFTTVYSTILGGLMVRNALEVNCALNNIRFSGKDNDSWNAYGSVFIDCYNVKFEGNKVLSNGRSGSNDQYYPRGGSLFLGGAGSLTVSNNDFITNDGVTLLVVPKFSFIIHTVFRTGPARIEFTAPRYAQNQSLDQVLASGNVFNVKDRMISQWSKIHMGVHDALSDLDDHYIEDLIFSQNQVALPPNPESDAWRSVFLRSSQMAFNGNIITGPALADAAILVSSKGIGLGNVLHKEPLTHDGTFNLAPGNNQW